MNLPAPSAQSSPGPSRWGTLVGGWDQFLGVVSHPLALALLTLLTLLSMMFTAVVIRSADHYRQTLLLLADVTASANHDNALTWQALAQPAFPAELQAELQQAGQALQTYQGRLLAAYQRDTADLTMKMLHRRVEVQAEPITLETAGTLLNTYLKASSQQLTLLAQGQRDEALRLDQTVADPTAKELNQVIGQLREHRDGEALVAVRLAVALALFSLLCMFFTLTVLAQRLRFSIQRAERLEREQQEERERAERDSLTGLWNRRGLHRQFIRWAGVQNMTVMVLDLNRLKAINDAGGHAAGDAHLQNVAQALLEVAHPHRLVARWGGDEFVLLLPGLTPTQAHDLAEQAISMLESPGEALPPFAYGSAYVSGVTSLERVLALADAAMYDHKDRQKQHLSQLGPSAPMGLSVEEFMSHLEQLETPQEVLGEALPLACSLLEFQGSVYLERDGSADGFKLCQVSGNLPPGARETLENMTYHAGMGLTGQAIARSVSRWSNDYPSEDYALPIWVKLGLKSVLIVPVRYGGQLMGLIGLLNYDSWRVVTPQVRRLMEAVASRLGHTFERAEAVEHVRHALQGGLLALGVALEERDLETAGHTERVVTLAEQLGARYGLNEGRLDALRQGASLHDIGKLVIPDAILLKPGKLSPEEWQIMQNHAARGFEIAHRLSGLMPATLDIIRSHHERWDGSGYPDRLSGEAIPLEARMFAICDVYDALTHARPYKRAWTHEEAMQEIRAQSGKHFDPKVVAAFEEIMQANQPVMPNALDLGFPAATD